MTQETSPQDAATGKAIATLAGHDNIVQAVASTVSSFHHPQKSSVRLIQVNAPAPPKDQRVYEGLTPGSPHRVRSIFHWAPVREVKFLGT
jgi:hypothetical protein